MNQFHKLHRHYFNMVIMCNGGNRLWINELTEMLQIEVGTRK